MRTHSLLAVRPFRRPRLLAFAILVLLATSVAETVPAAMRVRPYTPLHGVLAEIARSRGVPLEQVLADPEKWLQPEAKQAWKPAAFRREPGLARGLDVDASIQFGSPRLLGTNLSLPLVGDFDGDGVDDIAATTTVEGEVAILEGDQFQPLESRRDVTLEVGDVLLAVADLEGDERTDLIAGRTADSTIAVYRSLGKTGFDAPARYAVGAPPQLVLTDDLDGSGRIDLLVIPIGEGEVVTLLNDGAGNFLPGARVLANVEWGTATTADFDGDLRPDLAVAALDSSSSPRIRIYRNENDSTLAPWADLPDSASNWYGAQGALRAADVDDDDEQDLVEYGNGTVRVLRGLGGGAFTATPLVVIPDGSDPYPQERDLRVTDLDQDGYADALVALRSGTCYFGGCPRVSLLLGTSSGALSAPIHLLGDDPNSAPGPARGLVRGDFNSDGMADVAVSFGHSNSNSTLSALFGDGAGGLVTALSVEVDSTPRALSVLRRGAGQAPDLILGDGAHTWIADDVGPRGFTHVDSLGAGEAVSTLDLNGDALEDLVLADGGDVVVRLNDGSGGFAAPTVYSAGTYLTCANFDGMNGPDLAVADGTGRVLILPNDGSAGFGAPIDFGASLTSDVTSVTGSDLDLDGLADLLVGHNNGAPRDTLAIHWNMGGVFGPADHYEIGMLFENPIGDSVNTTRPSTIASGDFDGNELRDIFVVNFTFGDNSGSISILIQNAPRSFAPSADYQTAKDPWEGVVADFDADGRDDAAVVCDFDNYNGVVDVFQAQAGGTMDRLPGSIFGSLTAEHYPTSIAAGDWDSDGRPDLVAGNRMSRSVTFFSNTSPPWVPTPASVSPISAEVLAAGIQLEWLGVTPGFAATVERATSADDWQALGPIVADGSGHLRWVDSSVFPAARLGYRLSWLRSGVVQHGGEIWVDLPVAVAPRLTFAGAQPNPSRGTPVLHFTLLSAAEATLDLYDVGGRRVVNQRLESPGPGEQVIRMRTERPLAPGLYLAKITQSGQSATARIAIVP